MTNGSQHSIFVPDSDVEDEEKELDLSEEIIPESSSETSSWDPGSQITPWQEEVSHSAPVVSTFVNLPPPSPPPPPPLQAKATLFQLRCRHLGFFSPSPEEEQETLEFDMPSQSNFSRQGSQ